jgi:cobalamin biosynthetic protein CobC
MTTPAAPPDHGGRLAEASRLFPYAPRPFLDLSTGINPVPYPIPGLDPSVFSRLPEPGAEVALRAVAAVAYRVADPSMIAAAPGTQILIGLLPRLFPARHVRVLGPTYAEHAHAWRAGGAEVAIVPDVAALSGAETAVLCQPNNPDGRRQDRASLIALAASLAARGGFLVVDEAFADLEEGASTADALPRPGLIVLRSFGKTYGLAGARLGFALADAPTASVIREALGPWAVSGPAIAIGRAALADRAWLAATRARLAAETPQLDALIVAAGLRVVGGTNLFRLAEGAAAPEMFARLGRAGIFTRRFAERPDRLRFGFPGSPEDWERLRHALQG